MLHFIIDSAIAADMDVVAPVALRVNVDVNPETHAKISTGQRDTKFGISTDQREASDLYRVLCDDPHIRPAGLAVHIGSQIRNLAPFEAAYSALLAHDRARAEAGEFLLRIEDLDPARCRDHFEAQIYEDLDWLGIRWDGPVLRQSERRRAWRAIASGQAQVVVGARSALFLPYPNLGLIVVDEAHEASFKQEDGVHYHARDVAVVRAQREGALVLLGSEERRVGKECLRLCRSRWSPYH